LLLTRARCSLVYLNLSKMEMKVAAPQQHDAEVVKSEMHKMSAEEANEAKKMDEWTVESGTKFVPYGVDFVLDGENLYEGIEMPMKLVKTFTLVFFGGGEFVFIPIFWALIVSLSLCSHLYAALTYKWNDVSGGYLVTVYICVMSGKNIISYDHMIKCCTDDSYSSSSLLPSYFLFGL